MFTGIIEATAAVLEKSATGLAVARPAFFDDIKIGSSIAVAGVCLSITRYDDASMAFDVVRETWERTNLGALEEGSMVNLERALAAAGRFDGHIVQGHVEGVGTVLDPGTMLQIQLPDELIKNCVQKGSIALNGVSLTIAEQKNSSISVALIPHTREHTTLGLLKEGERVNVETDIIARYAVSIVDN